MGLMDILNGMQNGPKGQRKPPPPPQPGSRGSSAGGGGLSPLMMALLGLVAYNAFKGRGGQAAAPGQPAPTPPGGTASQPGSGGLDDLLGGLLGGKPGGAKPGAGGLDDLLGGLFGGKPGGTAPGGKPGGSLADMLPGGLGGLLGGAAAGSVLTGGLDNILKQLQNSGQGRVAQSWVGTGPNQEIAPDDLANALGGDTLDALSRQTGMPRDELLEGLSQYLPELVDKLTPNGRLPSPEEAGRMV
jgi:uncharacterized protein YidB (DUF937 family)